MQNFYKQMTMWQVSRWQKKEQPCLAGGEERLGAYPVFQGRSFLVAVGGGVAGDGRKSGRK
jgi:hypothetical protein